MSPAVDSVGPTRTGFLWALALLLCVPVSKAVVADSLDPDFFWHVRVAEQLLTEGIGPVSEPFSDMSSAGNWTPFSWLGELLMKWIYDGLGLPGVVGTHALCATLFYGFIAMSCLEATRQLSGERRYVATLVCVALAMLMSLPFLSFRPVTMALALLSAMHWLLWRDRRLPGPAAWLLVPATLLLTNLHLYVILWVVGLWARAVGIALDRWVRGQAMPRRDAMIALACSVASLGTPMLPGCIRNAIWFKGEDPMVLHTLVAEIAPFYSGILGKGLLACVVAIGLVAIQARRRIGFEHLLWLLAAGVFLFQMGRFASVFALIAMPVAAASFPRLPDRVLARRPLRLALAICTIIVAARISLGFPTPRTTMDQWLTRNGDADGLLYPTEAARFVEQHVRPTSGRLVNELTWGGYLIWRLGDRYQVFMDGRTLVYPAQFWKDTYLADEQTKARLLGARAADVAILPRVRSRLDHPLRELGWREVYSDGRAVVLVPPESALSASLP